MFCTGVCCRKVEQVAEEYDLMSRSLDRFGGREALRQREAQDRAELMARAEMGQKIKNEMDEEAAVMGHVTRSRRYLNDMYEQGTSVLANMSDNRERLKVSWFWAVYACSDKWLVRSQCLHEAGRHMLAYKGAAAAFVLKPFGCRSKPDVSFCVCKYKLYSVPTTIWGPWFCCLLIYCCGALKQ